MSTCPCCGEGGGGGEGRERGAGGGVDGGGHGEGGGRASHLARGVQRGAARFARLVDVGARLDQGADDLLVICNVCTVCNVHKGD